MIVDKRSRSGVRSGVLMVGHQLRVARIAQGKSLSALARDAEVGKSFLWRIENGEASPSRATLTRLANALGLDVVG
jgi:transcriptional regulator with XRE-family HTH domain